MYDYNFFENYKSKKKNSFNHNGLLITVVLGSVVILAGVTANSYYQNGKLVLNNLSMANELSLPENVDTFSRIESKQNLNIQLQEISQNLNGAVSIVDQREVIKQSLIDTLTLSLPSDAQILNLSISDNVISVNGVAAQRSAIAEFEKNLRDSGAFQSIAVTSINTQLDEYVYDMSISLGGVADENIN